MSNDWSVCPRCGYAAGFMVKITFGGAGREYYGEDGRSTEIDNDDMLTYSGKLVRCTDCGFIRRDLSIVNGMIVQDFVKE